jgi:hypothetical protein
MLQKRFVRQRKNKWSGRNGGMGTISKNTCGIPMPDGG